MNKSKWEFLLNAYNGTGGFYDGSYIDKFGRELDEKLKHRKAIATYTNHTAEVVRRFNDYLFKQKAKRDSKNELIVSVFESCNLAGDSIDIFMQSLFKKAFLLGSSFVLVDMPKNLGLSLAEQKSKRAFPYFVEISPLNLYDFSIKDGKFEWVILEFNNVVKTPFGEAKTQKEYHYFDDKVFEKRDASKKVIELSTHNLGICPVVALSLGDELFGDTLCYEVATLSKRLYNLDSELDEILRSQTFGVLTYQAQDGEPDSLDIGTDNALLYKGERPSFISPSPDSAEIYMKRIADIEDRIDKISLNPVNFSSKSTETGVALNFKYESLNSMLLSLAKKLEDFERRLFEVAFKWLNLNYDFSVSYPNNYKIADLGYEIEVANSLKEFGMPLSWESEKKKELAKLSLNSLDDEEIDEIYDEIAQSKEAF